MTGNGSKAVIVNPGGTSLTVTTGTLALAGNFATSGASAITFTSTGATNVTLPTTGTLGTLAGAEEFTSKTLNASVGKGVWTASGTWTLPAVTMGGTVNMGSQSLVFIDATLIRDSANALALRNGANDQTFHVGPSGGSIQLSSGPTTASIINHAVNGSTNYTTTGGAGSHFFVTNGTVQLQISNSAIFGVPSITAHAATAIPAGGTAGAGLLVSSTANFGVFFGSGAPTLSAAKGSLYLRSNGSGTTDRAYINTDGGTTWTALTTAA